MTVFFKALKSSLEAEYYELLKAIISNSIAKILSVMQII